MEPESAFEEHVNSILKTLPIKFVWNGSRGIRAPLSLPAGINPNYNYTPDFILNLRYKGRQVLLEPHGFQFFNRTELYKLYDFRKFNIGKYYLILITGSEQDFFKMLKQYNLTKGYICDEVWLEPRRSNKSKPQNKRKKYLPRFMMDAGMYPDGTPVHTKNYVGKSFNEIRAEFIRRKLSELIKIGTKF